jgi:hypothetical protein
LPRANAQDHPERKRVPRRRPIAFPPGLRVAAAALAAGLLFLGYLRVSWTVAATSDGAAQALQARDMLAGNWLLHGWTVSDVSFYTTELPEYVLVELVRPFGAGVIHVAAAVTYTLLVLAACWLARGRARGPEGLVRGVLAAGIMLAPQLGYGAFVLLLSPDHVGTQVPLLLGWLLLDLSPGGAIPRWPPVLQHWSVPVVLCLLLAWVQLADRVALVTAVLPLVLVCVVTLMRTVANTRPVTMSASRLGPARERAGVDQEDLGSMTTLSRGQRSTIFAPDGPADPNRAGRPWAVWRKGPLWPACWYEVTLGLAAVGSVGVAWAGARVLAAAGGFAAHPLPFTLAPLRLLWTHAWLTGWGILEVYGANFLGVTGRAGLTFAVLHLAGLALAVAGVAVALGRFLRPRGPADLVDSVLAVAIVANLASYVLSIEPGTVAGTGYDAREIAAVLPLGAVLAGRVFGPKLAASLRLARPLRHAPGRFREISGNVVAPQRPTFPDGADGSPLAADGLACAPSPCAVGPAMAGPTAHGRVTGLGSSAWAVLAFGLLLAGYAVAFGYSAAQPRAVARDQVLADWLVGHGLRYGLGGAAANIVTVDSGGRAGVGAVTVRDGRVRPLLYQSPAAAYDPRRHDATFLIARAPAARAGDAAEAIPAAAVRATFGRPARSYRFDGFTIEAWNVNLLTKMHG